MKYTKEQLQEMSDKEINTALATLVFDAQGAPYVINQTVTLSKMDKMRQDCLGYELYPHAIDVICGFGMRTDYCNNPSDIMPLAFEYAIGVEVNPIRTEWLARTCDISMSSMSFICYIDKKPLRAIACCLILVLQGEKE